MRFKSYLLANASFAPILVLDGERRIAALKAAAEAIRERAGPNKGLVPSMVAAYRDMEAKLSASGRGLIRALCQAWLPHIAIWKRLAFHD
jgi:hypothetical protein